jgi:hypothetical protein
MHSGNFSAGSPVRQSQIKPIWFRIDEFWRNGGESATFVQPLLNLAISAAMRSDPLMAAELALTVAHAPPAADRDAHESILKQVVGRLASVNPNSSPDDAEKLAKMVTRWSAVRPNCPLVTQLSGRVSAAPYRSLERDMLHVRCPRQPARSSANQTRWAFIGPKSAAMSRSRQSIWASPCVRKMLEIAATQLECREAEAFNDLASAFSQDGKFRPHCTSSIRTASARART